MASQRTAKRVSIRPEKFPQLCEFLNDFIWVRNQASWHGFDPASIDSRREQWRPSRKYGLRLRVTCGKCLRFDVVLNPRFKPVQFYGTRITPRLLNEFQPQHIRRATLTRLEG